jgi:hypothetical protein
VRKPAADERAVTIGEKKKRVAELDQQEDPEKYRDLVLRIACYSAYLFDLLLR